MENKGDILNRQESETDESRKINGRGKKNKNKNK